MNLFTGPRYYTWTSPLNLDTFLSDDYSSRFRGISTEEGFLSLPVAVIFSFTYSSWPVLNVCMWAGTCKEPAWPEEGKAVSNGTIIRGSDLYPSQNMCCLAGWSVSKLHHSCTIMSTRRAWWMTFSYHMTSKDVLLYTTCKDLTHLGRVYRDGTNRM